MVTGFLVAVRSPPSPNNNLSRTHTLSFALSLYATGSMLVTDGPSQHGVNEWRQAMMNKLTMANSLRVISAPSLSLDLFLYVQYVMRRSSRMAGHYACQYPVPLHSHDSSEQHKQFARVAMGGRYMVDRRKFEQGENTAGDEIVDFYCEYFRPWCTSRLAQRSGLQHSLGKGLFRLSRVVVPIPKEKVEENHTVLLMRSSRMKSNQSEANDVSNIEGSKLRS